MTERDAQIGIGIKLRVPAQRLGDALIIVVEDGGKRPKKMSRKDRAVRVREIKGKLFDFSDGGHARNVVDATV